MDSDADDYRYSSSLKYGFNTKKITKKSSVPVVTVDDSSDSDDCVIVDNIDLKKVDSNDKKVETKENKPQINGQNELICQTKATDASALTPQKEICIKPKEETLKQSPKNEKHMTQALDEKLDSFVKNIKHLKEDFKSETEKSDHNLQTVKNESIDVKPGVKLEAPDSDIKPFVLKIENGIKKEESLESVKNEKNPNEGSSDSTKTNDKPIKTKDMSCVNTKPSDEESIQESNSSSERFSVLLSILEKIRSQHQKPTFDRILSKYNKIVNTSDISDAKPILNSLISVAIDKRLIEKIKGLDQRDDSFRIISGYKRKRNKSKSSTNSLTESDLNSNLGTDSDSMPESNRNSGSSHSSAPNLESLALEGYTDISDIDINSAQSLFGDTELNPEIFKLYEVPVPKPSPTDPSFSSTPIKSFNHNRNIQVIGKKAVSSNSSKSSDKTNQSTNQWVPKKDYHNWPLETLPRYSPFIAQKGDRVVYLRDAHQIYINYELQELKDLYPKFHTTPEVITKAINSNDYIIKAMITDVKFYQINYIQFSVIQMKSLSTESPFLFNVLYRPNRGICDFIVLDSLYTSSQSLEWKPGEEFRSLWTKSWWMGKVISKTVFNKQYPDSPFKCYKVMWNTGEDGKLSPWDLFKPDPKRMPKSSCNGLPVIREDLFSIGYKPTFNDQWPEVYGLDMKGWRCHECKRIYKAFKFIEKQVFTHIVDIFRECLNSEIAYSVNLSLIKKRLKNFFYRRKESLIRDITYLKTNSKLYVKKSDFKNCEDFVDLLLGVANDSDSVNEDQFAAHLNKYSHLKEHTPDIAVECPPVLSPEDDSVVNNPVPSDSSQISQKPNIPNQCLTPNNDPKPSRKRKRSAPDTSQSKSNSEVKVTESTQWKEDSQKFIEQLLKNDDSMPYREPVDPALYPHYRTVISDPMDLSQIQRKLSSDEYLNPIEMRKDFRLMYENAKIFNKDPKSKIRGINKKLYNSTEDRLREIITDWDRVFNYEQKRQKSNGSKPREPTSRNQLWGYGYQQYY